MCGRFYVDDDLAEEVTQMFPAAKREGLLSRPAGDVVPSQKAAVLMRGRAGAGAGTAEDLLLTSRIFGSALPGRTSPAPGRIPPEPEPPGRFTGQGTPESPDRVPAVSKPQRTAAHLCINARAETAESRPAFWEAMRHSRCVIPVSAFYEFSPEKEKVAFRLGDGVFFLGGCVREDRFVILTTAPNASVAPVHPRMPVIIRREDVLRWILSPDIPRDCLTGQMPALSVHREYEQLSLDLSSMM